MKQNEKQQKVPFTYVAEVLEIVRATEGQSREELSCLHGDVLVPGQILCGTLSLYGDRKAETKSSGESGSRETLTSTKTKNKKEGILQSHLIQKIETTQGTSIDTL